MSHIKWKLWSWGFQWCKNNAKFRPYMVTIWRKKRKVCIQKFLIFPTFLMDKSKDIGQFQASFSIFLVGNTSRLYDISYFEWSWDVSIIFKKKVLFLRPPAGPVCKEHQTTTYYYSKYTVTVNKVRRNFIKQKERLYIGTYYIKSECIIYIW